MSTERINEIMSEIDAFKKDKYYRDELLKEMFRLQQELVRLTFNDEHSSLADLRIWDVENHFRILNEECDNVADLEIEEFESDCKELSNLIKAACSGKKGESIVFNSLERMGKQNMMLTNVELIENNTRTEIDALVFTPKGITIIEVKNTSKNIFIDESGNYYRTGTYLRWDSEIKKKQELREKLVKAILKNSGIENVPIKSMLVFTNNTIEVQNKCVGLETCFVSQLPHRVDQFGNEKRFSEIKILEMRDVVRNAECKEPHEIEMDTDKMKKDFAVLMYKLEEANRNKKEIRENLSTKGTRVWHEEDCGLPMGVVEETTEGRDSSFEELKNAKQKVDEGVHDVMDKDIKIPKFLTKDGYIKDQKIINTVGVAVGLFTAFGLGIATKTIVSRR